MKTDAMLATELLTAIEQRKQSEKRESALKDYFKTKLGNMNLDTISFGGVLISLIGKSRSGLDRKALVAVFGEDTINQYEKVTQYTQVDVKIINENLIAKAA